MRFAIGNQSIKPMNQRNTRQNVDQAGTGLIAHYILKNMQTNGDVSISLNNYWGGNKQVIKNGHLDSISEYSNNSPLGGKKDQPTLAQMRKPRFGGGE